MIPSLLFKRNFSLNWFKFIIYPFRVNFGSFSLHNIEVAMFSQFYSLMKVIELISRLGLAKTKKKFSSSLRKSFQNWKIINNKGYLE